MQKNDYFCAIKHLHYEQNSYYSMSKHVFLAGMPGSGKTNTMMYLISEMHKAGIISYFP